MRTACGVFLVALCVVSICVTHAQMPTPTPDDSNLPYCDELNATQPINPADESTLADDSTINNSNGNNDNNSNSNNAGTTTNSNSNNGQFLDSEVVPPAKAQQVAGEISQVGNQLQSTGVVKSVVRFGELSSRSVQRVQSLTIHMQQRQTEIDNLFSVTIPALESSIVSRRDRSRVVRDELRAINTKLRNLVDSLDRGTYVSEQQAYMTVLDSLTRIQNAIEIKLMATENPSGGSRIQGAALLGLNHESLSATEDSGLLIETAKKAVAELTNEKSPDRELLNELDLLEIESSTSSSVPIDAMPYQRRINLLLKRINSILSRLISKFSDIRQKHKDVAKNNRDVWSKQIDLLQQQSDDLTANLQNTLEETQFYLKTYNDHVTALQRMIRDQMRAYKAFQSTNLELREVGEAFNAESVLRASQLKKLQEISHYLLYPAQVYSDEVFAFACDGVAGGSAVPDACGVCGGANATCLDCTGTPNGLSEIDVCGVCGGMGKTCSYFCSGGANSGKLIDLCGECGGNSTICVGCDGVPNSGTVLDMCGVCGGDASSCSTDGSAKPVQFAIPGADETLVISKLQLVGTTFSNDWVSKHGLAVRKQIANVVNKDENTLDKVYLMDAEGSDSVVLSVGVSVATASANETLSAFLTPATFSTLSSSLASAGLKVIVLLFQGPTPMRI
eukprot:c6047_g1_i1.p1 GENE.c6047_g1_i1~~c6047_g1_i1.p1  ORF type:complete len:687 (-),score=218.05 c6047_g1_i1:143-2170(-)